MICEPCGKSLDEYRSAVCIECYREVLRANLEVYRLNIIEEILVEFGADIEDYSDPRKGITQLEAIIDALLKLVGRKHYSDSVTPNKIRQFMEKRGMLK